MPNFYEINFAIYTVHQGGRLVKLGMYNKFENKNNSGCSFAAFFIGI